MLTPQVRGAFNRAAANYDSVAQTQRTVVARLMERLSARASLAPRRILDAGCGTGNAQQALAQLWPEAKIISADIAEAMLSRTGAGHHQICCDIERLPFGDASIDLYWSSLALQWCDLERSAFEAARTLQPGGLLAISTLCEMTFAELRSAFDGIDGYSHTLELLVPEAVEATLRRAGFSDIEPQRLLQTEYHADFRSLLRQVKATGANQVSGRRRPGLLGRRAFALAEARYEEFRTVDGLPLHFDVLTVIARRV